jgi:formate C-acetyltransferase
MKGLIDAYAEGGGSAIQFNVADAKTLRKAQENPELYQNLQIRVCGWNVLFNNMCKEEQDAYIKRAESIA